MSKNSYKFATEKDLLKVKKEEIYDRTINNLRNTISNNYSSLTGYFQELFAINAISKIIDNSKSHVVVEWKKLEASLLDALHSNNKFKEIIDDGLYEVLDEDLFKDFSSFQNVMLGDPNFLKTLKDKDKQLVAANEKIEVRTAFSSKANDLVMFSNLFGYLLMDNTFGFNINDFKVNENGVLEDENLKELRKEVFQAKRFFNEVSYCLSDDYYLDMKNSLINEIENDLDRNRNILVTYSIFPELVTDEFNSFDLNDEQRDIAKFIISNKKEFKEKPTEFKNEFNKVINDSYRSNNIDRYMLMKK